MPKLCVVCDTPLTGRQRKYCSKTCKDVGQTRAASGKPTRIPCQVCSLPLLSRVEVLKKSHYECGLPENIAKHGNSFTANRDGVRKTFINLDDAKAFLEGKDDFQKYCDKCSTEIPYTYARNICRSCAKRNKQLAHKKNRFMRRAKGDITKDEISEVYFRNDFDCCFYCEETYPKELLHVDHIIPVSRGGSNHWNNLTLACRDCNLSKGNKTIFEWWGNKGSVLDNCHNIAESVAEDSYYQTVIEFAYNKFNEEMDWNKGLVYFDILVQYVAYCRSLQSIYTGRDEDEIINEILGNTSLLEDFVVSPYEPQYARSEWE